MPDAAAEPSVRLPTPEGVLHAADILRGHAHRTPTATSRTLNTISGARVVLKCENLQRSGAFKFRGAFHALSRLGEAERGAGVLSFSSGNHAGALALAGRLLGVRIAVIMPGDAPAAKRAATEGYGAEVIPYDRHSEGREALAARIRAERGMTLIPPYDHPDVVAGQGTAALELLEDAGPLDFLLVPCGGGGLLSGSALAAAALAPACRVIGVEPASADDAARTFRTGALHRTDNPATVADGLRTPSLGTVTWPLVREYVYAFRTVSEREIARAMAWVWTRCKLVIEPSAAVAVAPLLRRDPELAGARVGVVLSGGNVDLAAACALLTAPAPEEMKAEP